MPDYFVALDTTKYTKYHRALSTKGCIIQAALLYLDNHRKEILDTYSNITDFDKRFQVDEEYLRILQELADEAEIKPEGDEEYQRSLPALKEQMKQFLARDLWNMSDFMMLYNNTSDTFKKAYELVQQRDQDKLMLGR